MLTGQACFLLDSNVIHCNLTHNTNPANRQHIINGNKKADKNTPNLW